MPTYCVDLRAKHNLMESGTAETGSVGRAVAVIKIWRIGGVGGGVIGIVVQAPRSAFPSFPARIDV